MSDSADDSAALHQNGDLSGRQLGDYRLVRRLGRGGMADVYLAEQLSLRRQIALKVLKSDLAHDENYVKRFHMEARAAASLVHANIVQIHEVGRIDEVHFIAQEYVPGMNLKEWMTRRGLPEPKMAMLILRQVAAALQRAAEQGIVHRDIKPENVMLTQSGEVKVADFGLARVMGEGPGMNVTQAGVTMGTPLYMSPEQVEGKPLDPRSDIYSLGVTCYHMLAGETPFKGETALGVAVQHLNVQPPRLEKVRPDLPPGLCRIVHKMLAKSPGDRYPTARDLLKDLRALQADGFGDAWPDELHDWSPAELSALNSRSEATQRLDSLMKTEALVLKRQPQWKRYLLFGAAAAFLLGAAIAFGTREPFLLSQPATHPAAVEKKETAESQFLLASFLNTEDAWRAVMSYFPKDKKYSTAAKQQLAWLFLEQDDYARALQLFDEFAHMDGVETQYRAFGLAGRAVVLSLQGKYDQSARVLIDLVPLRDKLDSKMSRMVASVYRKNQTALNQKTSDEWEQWLQKSFPSEARPAGTT
ncbi:MAG TPA: serine/threonine-protein kinase [Pirellulales bacterium]|jgi:serine/threonine-protein kinase|nr:serine/threonine-protein kinase [Pirellulales bacterium]